MVLFWYLNINRKKTPTFLGAPLSELVPTKVYRKLLAWKLSVPEIRLLSASRNDNQSFLVKYTLSDQLQTVKRTPEACFEKSKGKKEALAIEVCFD